MWILKVLTKYRNWNARFKAYYQFHLYVKTQPFNNIESTFCNLNFKLTNHNRPHERLGSETNFTFKNQYYNFVGWIVWNKNTNLISCMKVRFYWKSFDDNGTFLICHIIWPIWCLRTAWWPHDGVEHWTWFVLKIDIL